MLADVDAGSDTPSLVGKVLKWRKDNAEAGEKSIVSVFNEKWSDLDVQIKTAKTLWDRINAENQTLSKNLLKLSVQAARYPEHYKRIIKYLSTIQFTQVSKRTCPLPFPSNPKNYAANE